MTKAELILKIHEDCPELGRTLIEDGVSFFFIEIANALQKGQRVELRGFGSFTLRKRESRFGRNPKTGERVQVEAKWSPFFKAGKELRDIVNKPSSPSPISKRGCGKKLQAVHTQQPSAR